MGRSGSVDWTASTAGALPPEVRRLVGDTWRRRAIAEHRSIGLFATYAVDLAGFGAPLEMVSLACRAALDEVRHTELFARLAGLYLDETVSVPAGTEAMPDDLSLSTDEQLAREALYLSVAAETFSMVSLGEQRRRATDPTVRDVYGIVLADELHHARMGWTLLDLLLRRDDANDRVRGFLASEVPRCFEHFVDRTFDDPSTLTEISLPSSARALAEGHGFMTLRDQYALYESAREEVWQPGFAALGVDARLP